MEATYIRVSTAKQNTITQEVKAIGKRYIDKVQGITPFAERVQGSMLISDIITGKIKHVYVNRVDRLGRNADDIQDTIKVFKKYKCQLTVTSMGNINLFENGKENFTFKMIMALYSQIAEQQRDELREKTQEGREQGKLKGKFKGRKKGTKESNIIFMNKHKDILNCLKNGMSLNDIVQTTKKSKPTIIKLKKLIHEANTVGELF
jgi:DNA invertase Pin-like site-specific DNA recombinase